MCYKRLRVRPFAGWRPARITNGFQAPNRYLLECPPQRLPNALGTAVFIPCCGRSVAAAVGESRDSKNICFVHPQQLGHLAHPALHCPRSILYLMRQAIGERSPKRSMQIVKLQNKPNPKNEHLTGETGNPIGEEEPK